MADFATMLYGGAQDTEQNVGAGAVRGVNQGITDLHQHAQLAIQQQQVDQQAQEIEMKKQQNQVAKIEKLHEYTMDAMKFQNQGDRNNALTSVIGYKKTMGLDDNAVPDSKILALKSTDMQGKAFTLNLQVQAGTLQPAEMMRILTSSEPEMQKILANTPVTPAELQNAPVDISAGIKNYKDSLLKQQAEKNQERKLDIQEKAADIANKKLDAVNNRFHESLDMRAKSLGNRTQLSANKDYTSTIGKTEGALYAADRINHIIDKISSGDLKSTKTISSDLNAATASLLAQGRPSTVYGQQATHQDDLYERVQNTMAFLSASPQDTQAPAKLEQLKKDTSELRNFYGQQHEQQYSSFREGLPEDVQPAIDKRFNTFRSSHGLAPLGVNSDPDAKFNIGGHDMSITQMKAFSKQYPNDAAVKLMQPYIK